MLAPETDLRFEVARSSDFVIVAYLRIRYHLPRFFPHVPRTHAALF